MRCLIWLPNREGNPVDPETVKADFDRVKKEFDYVTVEGSGGIVRPIRWDEEQEILLEDIVKMLHLNTLVIADAGLGTINAVVPTVEYIRNHGMDVKGNHSESLLGWSDAGKIMRK